MGFAGCSDDSGSSVTPNELLKVNPENFQLSKGGTKNLTVTHTAPSITATSSNDACIKVTKIDPKDQESTVTVTAVSEVACDATILIKGDSKNVEVTGAVVIGKAFIELNPSSLEMAVGATKQIEATVEKDGQKLNGEELSFTVTSGTDCIQIDPAKAMTDAQGSTFATVTTFDKECSAVVSVASTSDTSVETQMNVKVTKTGSDTPVVDPDGKGRLEFVELTPKSGPVTISLNGEDPKKSFSIRYLDENETTISGARVGFEVQDTTCIKLTGNKNEPTNEQGIATNGVAMVGTGSVEGCSTSVIISTSSAKVEPIIAKVSVAKITDYTMEVAANLDAPKTAAKIGYARTAYLGGGSCDDLLKDYADWPSQIDGWADPIKGETTSIESSGKPLASFKLNFVPVGNGAVVAYAQSDETSEILAYGCTDVKTMETDVQVDLMAIPTNLSGEYTLVSNFDLTSGFAVSEDKNGNALTGKDLPAAEKMAAGDWVNFVADLFNKPVDTLFSFVWANTIPRLSGITDAKWMDTIMSIVNSPMTYTLALSYLKPLIEDYLSSKEEGKRSWYDILTMVSPDVADLVRNMQITGVLTLPKSMEKNNDGLYWFSNATANYTQLHYQWSYIPVGKTKPDGCRDDAYAKPFNNTSPKTASDYYPRCRVALSLKDGSVTGKFNGRLDDTASADGLLTVDPHTLNFKWATVLFATVFGSGGILPSAIPNYTVLKDANGKDLYLGSFMAEMLFEPIVKSYKNKYNTGTATSEGCFNVTTTKEDGTTETRCFPAITQPDTEPCYQFLEALVYMVYPDANKTIQSMIPVVGSFACDQGLSQLDNLVLAQLNKFQSNSKNTNSENTNSFTINTTKACTLYSNGTTSYQEIGKADEKVWTANEIVNGTPTNRCGWDLVLSGQNQTTIKGYFHATRGVKDNLKN